MNINRRIEYAIKFLLDECMPPILRDHPLLMKLALKLVFRNKAASFLSFKQRVAAMTQKELRSVYADISSVTIQHSGTDLSSKIMDLIGTHVTGSTVLEAGCGQGILADRLSKIADVMACDLFIDDNTPIRFPAVTFRTANIINLPFSDRSFDTVICSHTLEHIPNLNKALRELRRVTAKRLIIVLPKERPYLFTFNLHIHFFPYRHSVEMLVAQSGLNANIKIEEIDGDWFLLEDRRP